MIAAFLFVCVAWVQGPQPKALQDTADAPTRLVPEGWRALRGDAATARAAMLAGLAGELSTRGWEELPASADGVAVARATVELERAEVRLARLPGARALLVNGVPFVGDAERRGLGGVPVALRAGENELVVIEARQGFELELLAPGSRVVIEERALGLPELTRDTRTWNFRELELPIFNASTAPLEGLHVHYADPVPEDTAREPALDEWACGGEIAPLCLLQQIVLLGARSDRPERVEVEAALMPVLAYAVGDPEVEPTLLRLPLSGPSGEEQRPHAAPDPAEGSAAALFEQAALLVYGTAGDDAEDAALLARARFDQQRLWYASGRAPEVVTDRSVLGGVESRGGKARTGARRPLVLYGNADTNAAWARVLGEPSALLARRGRVELEGREHVGEELAGYALLPRAGAEAAGARVLVLFDTGLAGTRLGALLDPLESVEPSASRLLRDG